MNTQERVEAARAIAVDLGRLHANWPPAWRWIKEAKAIEEWDQKVKVYEDLMERPR